MDNQGRTALMWAVDKGHNRAVKLLVAWGSRLTTQDLNGDTPFTLASKLHHEEIQKILREFAARKGRRMDQDLPRR